VSFPNELQNIADVSGHLTPKTLGEEVRKLKRDVPIYLYGRKPRHTRIINAQLKALHEPRLKLLAQGPPTNI